MEPIIRIEGLRYCYEENKEALSNLNVEIYPETRVAVLGSNGAGKSTFFLNLNGVYTPDGGHIYYKGMEITKKNRNELRKRVGFVFQDADHQILASSVMAEVSFGPMNLKLPREEVKKRTEQAMEHMNITQFRQRPPHYLSGGEKKRVSIADIMAMEPEVYLFDEPTASLDPQNAGILEEILNGLSKEKKTILVSTHDVDFAYRWADRVLVFGEGGILADGRPEEIFHQEEILKRANLKRPMMFEIYELLKEKNLLQGAECIYPKEIEGLRQSLHHI